MYFSFAVLVAIVTIGSCKKDDPCENVTCLNSGTCNNGTCACPTGYQGTTCNTETRAKYIGVFAVTEMCGSGVDTYSITIDAVAGNVAAVTITNLYDSGFIVNGTLDASGGISIPTQSFGPGNISGSISSSGDVSYTITFGGSSDSCVFRINI